MRENVQLERKGERSGKKIKEVAIGKKQSQVMLGLLYDLISHASKDTRQIQPP